MLGIIVGIISIALIIIGFFCCKAGNWIAGLILIGIGLFGIGLAYEFIKSDNEEDEKNRRKKCSYCYKSMYGCAYSYHLMYSKEKDYSIIYSYKIRATCPHCGREHEYTHDFDLTSNANPDYYASEYCRDIFRS